MTTSRLAGLVLLGLGLHLATPAAEAQPPVKLRRVGYLTPGGACGGPTATGLGAFRERLGQLGWLEGKNVAIVCRTGKYDCCPRWPPTWWPRTWRSSSRSPRRGQSPPSRRRRRSPSSWREVPTP